MPIKKAKLQMEIDKILCDIYPHSSADIIQYDEISTVADKIAYILSILDELNNGSNSIDNKIKIACDAIFNKILGATDQSDLNEAFDTLKEVSDYLANHGSVVDGINNSINEIKQQLNLLSSKSHIHDNKDVIDKLSISDNGKLLFDGKEISGNNSDITSDASWGYITGTLDNQKDLKTALDAKATVDDANSSASTTYSSEKINSIIPKVPVNLSELNNDKKYIDNTVNDLLNYYDKSKVYTKDEIYKMLGGSKISYKIVTALPTTDISTNTVYLIKEEDENYSQHMYIESKWAYLGSMQVNLDDYILKEDIINDFIHDNPDKPASASTVKKLKELLDNSVVSIQGSGSVVLKREYENVKANTALNFNSPLALNNSLIASVYKANEGVKNATEDLQEYSYGYQYSYSCENNVNSSSASLNTSNVDEMKYNKATNLYESEEIDNSINTIVDISDGTPSEQTFVTSNNHPNLVQHFDFLDPIPSDNIVKDKSRNHNDAIKFTKLPTIEYDEELKRNVGVFNGNQYIPIGTAGKVQNITVTVLTYVDLSTFKDLSSLVSCTQDAGWCINQCDLIYCYINSYISIGLSQYLTNGWHMISFTYNSAVFKIYIDDKMVYFLNRTGKIYYNSSNGIIIGAEASNDLTSEDGCYTGKIADVRIYNKALDASEIKNIYDSLMNNRYYIKQDDKYYNIKEPTYNSETNMYNSIDIDNDPGFDIHELLYNATLNSETFTPLSKFGKFKIVSKVNHNLHIDNNILAKPSGMIITASPISLKKYAVIHSITANATLEGNATIKYAFSFDNGTTWKTYSSEWELLDIDIPLKAYSELNDLERQKWNTAKDTILSSGIDGGILSRINFNNTKNMLIAIVIKQEKILDTAILNSLSINYDGLEEYEKLKDTEYALKFCGDTVTITPKAAYNKIILEMITNI